jgi:hypothetical protein
MPSYTPCTATSPVLMIPKALLSVRIARLDHTFANASILGNNSSPYLSLWGWSIVIKWSVHDKQQLASFQWSVYCTQTID